MGIINYSEQLKFTGKGYLDAKMMPVENVSDLKNISITQRFEGLTVTVLRDENGNTNPQEYWLIGGVTNSCWIPKTVSGNNSDLKLALENGFLKLMDGNEQLGDEINLNDFFPSQPDEPGDFNDMYISSVDYVYLDDNNKQGVFLCFTYSDDTKKYLDMSQFLSKTYESGDGIAFDETERKFSIDLKNSERFLVVDASGLGTNETVLWAAADEKYDAKNAAKNALESSKIYADSLNTTMSARVKTLEEIDYSVYAKNNDVYSKEASNSTFVKVDNFNEFSQELETKLDGIVEGAQANVIESVTINGVDATIEGKNASVKVEADDIELGTSIKNGEEDKYAANTKLSAVLQGIQDSIRGAIAGGVNSVSAGDTAITVNSADVNNPVISLNVEKSTETTVADGHIEIIKSNEGIYAAMYYGGDDAE